MIRAQHLTKSWQGRSVVDDLSFDVPAGQVTGLVGPNCAGKTTTLKMLLGLVRSDLGVATVDGMHYRELGCATTVVGRPSTGLTAVARRPCRRFSLGMRKRGRPGGRCRDGERHRGPLWRSSSGGAGATRGLLRPYGCGPT
ncbi:ATP-binding cassette domain-containing protein [uncultured Friedmanniella sp.]|uniref:ATP-binding cassette domain-containing protein n=1 Tax=uncultured Friedmanniella sp. TaxID=335381 RepID=UPI0035CC7540